MACAYRNFGSLTPTKSHIRIIASEDGLHREAVYCWHCEDPVCAAACPVDAIEKDEKTGWVRVNPIKCIGCRSCTFACPVASAWFDEDQKSAAKCTFCDGDPLCARFCSPQAIRVVTRSEASVLLGRMLGGGGNGSRESA
jgi:Fe-S-cluster-containing dehydrogenase component